MPIPDHTFEFEEDDIFLLPQEPWKAKRVTPIAWLERTFPQFLYTSGHIVRNSVPYQIGDGPNKGGVYFLVNESEVIYTGQSNNIYKRLVQHRKTGFPFSHYWCFGGIPQMFLENVELYYIYTMEPALNNKYPPLYEPAGSFVKACKQGRLQYAKEHC